MQDGGSAVRWCRSVEGVRRGAIPSVVGSGGVEQSRTGGVRVVRTAARSTVPGSTADGRPEGGHGPDSNRGSRIGAGPSATSWAAERLMARRIVLTPGPASPPPFPGRSAAIRVRDLPNRWLRLNCLVDCAIPPPMYLLACQGRMTVSRLKLIPLSPGLWPRRRTMWRADCLNTRSGTTGRPSSRRPCISG